MIGMIGIIGILGAASAIIGAIVTAVSVAVSVGVSVDQAAKQKEAQEKAESMQEKQMGLEKSMRNKASLRSRRAAATGTLAMIIEAKRNKYKTDATYRKLSRMKSTKSMLGQARVNRGTYKYGTPVGS